MGEVVESVERREKSIYRIHIYLSFQRPALRTSFTNMRETTVKEVKEANRYRNGNDKRRMAGRVESKRRTRYGAPGGTAPWAAPLNFEKKLEN